MRWSRQAVFGRHGIAGASTAVLAAIIIAAPIRAQVAERPDGAHLVLDDLRNFREALRALSYARTIADSIAVLEQRYLNRATPGLRAYAARYSVRADSLAAMIARRPRYYATLVGLPERVLALEPRIRAAFAALERAYPAAVYPPVYFLVADFKAGGVTRPEGLLIAVEIFGRGDSVPTHEVPDADRVLQPTTNLVPLVAHELAHFEQAMAQGLEAYRAIFGERQSLLALAIREGSADFVGELISGASFNSRAREYGLAHERELWGAFSQEMRGRESGDWLFVRPKRAEWPQDLGYFIGHRVTQAYYESHTDRAAALRAILSVTDYEAFLRESGYAARF